MIEIRKTEIAELGILMELFEQGKRIMRKSGNLKQWTGGYPDEELVKKDIENGNSYVCLDEERNIVGTFTFIQGDDLLTPEFTKEPGVTIRVPTACHPPPGKHGAKQRGGIRLPAMVLPPDSQPTGRHASRQPYPATHPQKARLPILRHHIPAEWRRTAGFPKAVATAHAPNHTGRLPPVFLLQLLHASFPVKYSSTKSLPWLLVRVSVPKKKENSSICSSKIRSFVSRIRL